ncbi:MAG: hypothetical protein A2V57_05445 [Candidatus Aminicenantes bacterium RBG_19FT_COMBO_65_30]|nr:MAG: hypothetical protein A2V57_05445 [Candidatus Aminicenantes bacterium RBG_19FT_COMBO_65_30]
MRILLVQPPFYRFLGYYSRYFPYGLLSLGTVLKKDGHDVRVYDADYNSVPSDLDISRVFEKYDGYLSSFKNPSHPIWQEVRKRVSDLRPDIVGIQVYTDFCASAFYVSEICKQVDPGIRIIMGGPHIHSRYGEVLDIAPAVDFVVRGEGENAVAELIARLGRGETKPQGIPGVLAKGSETKAAVADSVANLDAIPFPDRQLLLNNKKYTSEDLGLIMTTRGCPYRCAFCATETRRPRYRSVDHVLEEIRQIKAEYGTVQFTIKDDTFIVHKDRIIEYCEKLLAGDLRIHWECNGRANLINEELLKLMKRAGCNFIKIGVESGSPRMLEKMKKQITIDEYLRAAETIRRVGIHWTGYFMIGAPGENEADMHETLSFMRELKPDFAYLGTYQPYPGTEMFDEGVGLGLIKPLMSYEEFFEIPPDQYYKRRPVRQVETMTQDKFKEIEKIMMTAFHRYNKNILRALKMARARTGIYLSEPKMLIYDLRKYRAY